MTESQRWSAKCSVHWGAVLVGSFALLWSTGSRAATVSVDCTAGPEPLFEAVAVANCDPDPDIILVSGGACVWSDTSPQEARSLLPAITTPITIRGVEATPISLEAPSTLGRRNRFFLIEGSGRLRLVRLTLRGGTVPLSDFDYGGGAVLNEGTLEARHVTFVESRSVQWGGALRNQGEAHLISTTFEDNETGALGGAIYSEGNLTVSHSYFTGNSDQENGGAIFSFGELTIDDSLFYHNASEDAGGIDSSGTVIIRGSTFLDNSGLNAGAIAIRGGDLFLSDSEIRENWSTYGGASGVLLRGSNAHILRTTIASNTAELGAAGVESSTSQVLIDSCTISDNGPPADGASYLTQGMEGSGFTIVNSTLSGNRSTDGDGGTTFPHFAIELSDSVLVHNTIIGNDSPLRLTNSTFRGNILSNEGQSCELINSTSDGYNLSTDASCGLSPLLGDLPETDARLGPLTDNGGPTLTHLPLLGSPVLGAVPAMSCLDLDGSPLLMDQRGAKRAIRDTCDIGSVERRLR